MLKEISDEEALRIKKQGGQVYATSADLILLKADGKMYASKRVVDFGAIDMDGYCSDKYTFFLEAELEEPMGIPAKKPKMSENAVRNLYTIRQYSMKKIAEYYGVTEGQVFNFCKKHGIDRNNPADYPDTRSKAEGETK